MDCQIHAYNARMSIISKIFGPGSAKGKEAEDNPALTFIKSAPQDRVTEALVTAFPAICGALLDGAKKNAERIGLTDALFVQCIIDLELLGGFDIVVGFTGDNRLASAYIDAIVFDLTGKNPSIIPSETELWSGGTEKYRGVAKYIMAKDSFQLPRPEAHLFGKEYSQIRTGSPADLAEIASWLVCSCTYLPDWQVSLSPFSCRTYPARPPRRGKGHNRRGVDGRSRGKAKGEGSETRWGLK